jgi:hypothetical protein
MQSGNAARKNAFAEAISSILRFPAASILTSVQYLEAAVISFHLAESIGHG